ncbi:MAG TPA: response regulator transcription factor [Mesotoga prima]|nr:response regulator transcription factor [Mesotoga prima]
MILRASLPPGSFGASLPGMLFPASLLNGVGIASADVFQRFSIHLHSIYNRNAGSTRTGHGHSEVIRLLRILLVEDDENLANGISYALTQEGWATTLAGSVSYALEMLESGDFDLALLDVMLPDGNGFELCKKIRERSEMPIIFLTARDEEVNIVMGLESGADDYVTKPFRLRELISRIKANARRIQKRSVEEGGSLKSGPLELNTSKLRAYRSGKEIILTPTEFKILRTLMENEGIVLGRDRLLQKVWDVDGEFIDDNTLSVHIRKLREKVEEDPSKPKLIETLRGLGYRWNGGK